MTENIVDVKFDRFVDRSYRLCNQSLVTISTDSIIVHIVGPFSDIRLHLVVDLSSRLRNQALYYNDGIASHGVYSFCGNGHIRVFLCFHKYHTFLSVEWNMFFLLLDDNDHGDVIFGKTYNVSVLLFYARVSF
jgi:hypothetical protein